nr:integrase, catalytic region, zinc finger, CCHC-type, peptidase aspartic, catalytic [Tanacetum cinerariifolium]
MSTMAENVIAAGAENHPSMLKRSQYDSWQSQGSKISLQERESKLYNEFDRFTSKKEETIHSYYLRFAELINDMNTIGMTMQKLQVNTKFVNNLQPGWSKFVTNVKLPKDMHNVSFNQLYAYLRQHEVHANEVRMQSYQAPVVHQQPYQTPVVNQQSPTVFPQMDSSLAVPSFLPTGTKPLFKMAGSQRKMFKDDKLRVMQVSVQRIMLLAYGLSGIREMLLQINPGSFGATIAKVLVTLLNRERVDSGSDAQALTTTAIFWTDDLDTFDSDCDEAPSASAFLMAKLFAYDLDVLSEVPNYDSYQDNNVIDQSV